MLKIKISFIVFLCVLFFLTQSVEGMEDGTNQQRISVKLKSRGKGKTKRQDVIDKGTVEGEGERKKRRKDGKSQDSPKKKSPSSSPKEASSSPPKEASSSPSKKPPSDDNDSDSERKKLRRGNSRESKESFNKENEGSQIQQQTNLGGEENEDDENEFSFEKATQPALGEAQRKKALEFLRTQKYKKYHKWIVRAANNGDGEAQFRLAAMYSQSNMCGPRDYQKAFELYKKAANNGYVNANYEVALFYLGAKDESTAIKWLEKGAKQGHQAAEMMLRDFKWEEKLEACKKKAQQNGINAQYTLGLCHEYKGEWNEALQLYLSAARGRHLKSCERIAFMHRFGRGVSKDLKVAFEWYKAASRLGSERAQVLFQEMDFVYTRAEGFAICVEESVKNIMDEEALKIILTAYKKLHSNYTFGLEAPKNLKKAILRYKTAAILGSELAKVYFQKIGVVTVGDMDFDTLVKRAFQKIEEQEAFNIFEKEIVKIDEGMPSGNQISSGG